MLQRPRCVKINTVNFAIQVVIGICVQMGVDALGGKVTVLKQRIVLWFSDSHFFSFTFLSFSTHHKCGHKGGTSTCPDCRKSGSGKKAFRTTSPPQRWISDNCRTAEGSIEDDAKPIIANYENSLNDVKEQIRSVHNDYDAKRRKVAEAGNASCEQELSTMAKPGGVAYRFEGGWRII